MIFVSRKVRPMHPSQETRESPQAVGLPSLQAVDAWVLLGEPGSGKSDAFEQEAKACGGVRIPIAQFIAGDILEDWRNRCLFLDGLDEVRASGSDRTILNQVRSRLIALGRPAFRIACRAADWYGQSDREDIVGASPNGKILIYVLEPLDQKEIKNILEHNFGHQDSDQFIEKAKQHGIESLLSNPQTLQLMSKALKGNTWPDSRNTTYLLACKSIIQEENKRHRDHTRFQRVSHTDLLDAAGQLFAKLLLSDQSGVALDRSVENDRFPTIELLEPTSTDLAAAAIGTNLFAQARDCEERLEPCHRSVAEYLAAHWLGNQIDKHGLPLSRILQLMLGFDDKTVAGLRGLYGWLAVHSLTARHTLINFDPLTVALYGDPGSMDLAGRKELFLALQSHVQANIHMLWKLGESENLGALFHNNLRPDFENALRDPARDESSQALTLFVVKVIKQAGSRTNMVNDLRLVASDGTRWETVRKQALDAWLNMEAKSAETVAFLDQVNQSNISDPDDELAGIILDQLFPKIIQATVVLRYLHTPKTQILGMYQHFWVYRFPKVIPSGDLPVVLEQLSQRNDLQSAFWERHHLSAMIGKLVTRGIKEHGDNITDSTLFFWLRLGTNIYGEIQYENEHQAAIATWLADRPERYKGLLGICYLRNESNPAPLPHLFSDCQVLRGTPAPPDIGLWHFQHIDKTANEILVKDHLSAAVRSLWSGQANSGLSLEMILDWAGNDPIRLRWLDTELTWPLQEWRTAEYLADQKRELEQSQIRRDRSIELAKNIAAIQLGTANPALMGLLAGIWSGRYIDARGATALDRFKSYCDNYQDVFNAAKIGFRACLGRSDLPSVVEIIKISLQDREYFLRKACLIGADLIWSDMPSEIEDLSAATLQTLVCFRLTDGTDLTSDWFAHLAKNRSELVAPILVAYADAFLRAKKEPIHGLYLLPRNADFKRVADRSVPLLLGKFPNRIKSTQLYSLRLLLVAALKYAMPELPAIVARKLRLKSLQDTQKIYWLFIGTLTDPATYEQNLWDFIGKSEQRIRHLADFFGSRFDDLPVDFALSAKSIAKFIEIQTPYAEVDWPTGGGTISQAMQLGELVNGLIGRLTASGTSESLVELNRLIELPSLTKIKIRLQDSRHELIQKIRENRFDFPPIAVVVQILNNKEPTSFADLLAITLEHIDQITRTIRNSNSDPFRQFWTEEHPNKHKSENSCRDAFLTMLQSRLALFGISSDPEVDYINDKRADIRVSYRDLYSIPVEIKGEWNESLWTGIQNQLIDQYASANGYGIYLVLWVGGFEQVPPRDGGKKATTPEELRERLARKIPPEFKGRIAIRVLDISWSAAAIS